MSTREAQRIFFILNALQAGPKTMDQLIKAASADGPPMAERTFYRLLSEFKMLFGEESLDCSNGLYSLHIEAIGSHDRQFMHFLEFAVKSELLHVYFPQLERKELVMDRFDLASSGNCRWLAQAAISVCKKVPVQLTYYNVWADEQRTQLVHPHQLKQYDGAWYMKSFRPEDGQWRHYNLNRVLELLPQMGDTFQPRLDFNPDEYINCIGVRTDGCDFSEVLLKTSGRAMRFLHYQPLHHSQQVVEQDDKSTTFQYKLYTNPELENAIMGMGEEVEVLGPSQLRETIASRLRETTRPYLNQH